MESGIVMLSIEPTRVVDPIDANVCIVASPLLRDAANRFAYRSRGCDASIEVIAGTVKILFPDNDGVISGGVRDPFGIDGGIFTERLSEHKLIGRVCRF